MISINNIKYLPKKIYNLEKNIDKNNIINAVKYRRKFYKNVKKISLKNIPYINFDYNNILNKNCENVIGYINIPIGIVGPIHINNMNHFVPIATTEGALVGSINRGSRFIERFSQNGITSIVIDKGITRAPLIDLIDINNIPIFNRFIKDKYNDIKNIFDSTSNFIKLQDITLHFNGSKVHIRFSATSGNAMGMNMISKSCEKIMNYILTYFPNSKLLSLSGNLCIDKKPSAINWINGRGKTSICNTKINIDSFEKYSKISVDNIVELNIQKNLIGSSLAGSIGGMNAHSSNIIAGIFAATGQDLGQIGTSSVGITDYTIKNNILNIDLTMPSLEVGIIGGGTQIPAQKNCINIMNINDSSHFSKVIASTVLCGELSLMTALCKGNLVSSHIKYNRGIK